MLFFEMIALAIVLGLSLAMPSHVRAWQLRRRLKSLARRRTLCIVAIGVAAFVVQAGFGLLVHMPEPTLHDEFSYMLSADTFASGRLTNPTHPLWEHFESYNIIHVPTYQSKYPPGQGLTLAIGQLTTGLPIVGVWLTVALACAAVTWMGYAWLPARWAPLAGLLVATNFRLIRFWGHSYMGGGLALLGGALLFGGLRLVIRKQRPRDAMLMATGMALLSVSRPYEGLVASAIAMLVLVAWSCSRHGLSWSRLTTRVAAPLVVVLIVAFCGLGLYNQRVTGSALKWPYQVWLETYSTERSLVRVIWRPGDDVIPEEPATRRVGTGPKLGDWQNWFDERSNARKKIFTHWGFYCGLTLTPALIALAFAWQRGWTLIAIGTCLAVWMAIGMQNTHGHPHYAAPIGGLLAVLVVRGLRLLSRWTCFHRPVGQRLGMAIPWLLVVLMMVYLSVEWIPRPVIPDLLWGLDRARLKRQLIERGGQHVVVVRPSESEESGIHWHEWVYNQADIDRADVIWARDLGPQRNQRLAEYYAGRSVWLLNLQERQFSPYPNTSQTAASKGEWAADPALTFAGVKKKTAARNVAVANGLTPTPGEISK